jgi:uncharacterized protein YwgA
MQKGVFLLEMRGPAPWHDLYSFHPYDWGPYSRQLQADLGTLLAEELMEKAEYPSRRYRQYQTTALGERKIEDVLASMPTNHNQFVRNVRRFVTTRSFTRLLRDVYAEYPQFAVNSRFQG